MPADGPKLTNKLGVELIHAGKWSVSTGVWNATPECLASAVEAQKCPAIRPPVLKLGHRDSRFDGDPALGWVQALRTANGGKTLVGDFVGMPAALNQIMATAYPDRSVEGAYDFRCAAGHTHPFVLTGVALLGVTPPGIATLKSFRDVASMYGLAASATPQIGGTPVVVTIRASAPSTTSARTADPSALTQTRSQTAMATDVSRPRRSGESVTAWGVATGRISASIAEEWDRRIAASELSESGLEDAILKLLPPTPRISASAARPPAQRASWNAEEKATVAGSSTPHPPAVVPPAPAQNPAYRRNPLVDDVRASAPNTYRHGLGQGQPPTLFASGDLPVYCASGMEPSLLLKVPWLARHPIAAAASQAEANDLLEYFSGSDGEDLARAERLDMHFGNRDYQLRVNEWVRHSDQVAAAAARRDEETKIAAASGGVKAAHELTGDELYDAVFGRLEAQEEQRRLDAENAILEGRAVGHARSAAEVRASQQRRVEAAASRPPVREVWERYHPAAMPVGERGAGNSSASIDWTSALEDGE